MANVHPTHLSLPTLHPASPRERNTYHSTALSSPPVPKKAVISVNLCHGRHHISGATTPTTTPSTTGPGRTGGGQLSNKFFHFILAQFLLVVPAIFVLIAVIFFIVHTANSPVSTTVNKQLAPRRLRQHVRTTNCSQPLVIRCTSCLNSLLRNSLNAALASGRPIDTVLTRCNTTAFRLTFLTLVITLVINVNLKHLTTHQHSHTTSTNVHAFTVLYCTAPIFFLNLILGLVFTV